MFIKPVMEVGEEEFDHLFAVNVMGAFFCSQEAARSMAEDGRIINLSSSTKLLAKAGNDSEQVATDSSAVFFQVNKPL